MSFKKLALTAVILGSTMSAFAAPVVTRPGGYQPDSAIAKKDPYHLSITIGGIAIYTFYAATSEQIFAIVHLLGF
ncbi:hypothetical protein [Granulicella arctica]|uniref:hypothetical protein n=1 Tax=Granulicella arctica TaxID=940613 RepID=UPI0021E0E2CE|nr:hypothetical protein [Granulicella arctica]